MAKVSKQLEREIGSLLLLDPRLQEAVCPEVGGPSCRKALTPLHARRRCERRRPVQPLRMLSLQRRQGMDAALSGLASVTGIALSGDLQVRGGPAAAAARQPGGPPRYSNPNNAVVTHDLEHRATPTRCRSRKYT